MILFLDSSHSTTVQAGNLNVISADRTHSVKPYLRARTLFYQRRKSWVNSTRWQLIFILNKPGLRVTSKNHNWCTLNVLIKSKVAQARCLTTCVLYCYCATVEIERSAWKCVFRNQTTIRNLTSKIESWPCICRTYRTWAACRKNNWI